MVQKVFTNEILSASDVNVYLAGEGGQWTAFTPQIDQGASINIAKTVTYGRYARYGRTIIFNFTLVPTAGGTAGSQLTVTLPVTAVSGASVTGSGAIYDTSTTTRYPMTIVGASTTQASFVHDEVSPAAWGQAPNIAIASGDEIRGSITYEAAS